jgi:hypothetical protein
LFVGYLRHGSSSLSSQALAIGFPGAPPLEAFDSQR